MSSDNEKLLGRHWQQTGAGTSSTNISSYKIKYLLGNVTDANGHLMIKFDFCNNDNNNYVEMARSPFEIHQTSLDFCPDDIIKYHINMSGFYIYTKLPHTIIEISS